MFLMLDDIIAGSPEAGIMKLQTIGVWATFTPGPGLELNIQV